MTNEELVQEYQHGNEKAFELLVEQNKGIIKFMVKKWWSVVANGKASPTDLESECVLGLFFAVKSYKDADEKLFANYAFHRIQWHLYKIYHDSEKHNQNGEVVSLCSIDDPVPGTDDLTIGDTIADDYSIEDDISEKVTAETEGKKLWKAVDSLGGKYSDVIRKRYKHNESLETIADEYFLSAERIRQIEKQALKLLGKMQEVKRIADYYSPGCSAEYHGSLRKFKETGLSSVEFVVMKKLECESRLNKLNKELLTILS